MKLTVQQTAVLAAIERRRVCITITIPPGVV
jgi:hypothetical protein